MKMKKAMLLFAGITTIVLLFGFTVLHMDKAKPRKSARLHSKGCVFQTVFGEQSSAYGEFYKIPEKVLASMNRGLSWMAAAQNENGGWGAGSHSRQDLRDPHAVPSDPATTSMVTMSLLRSGHTLTSGEFAPQVQRAIQYLLSAVESSSEKSPTITTETNTQIQIKLGQNIDVILTAQCLSNALDYVQHDASLKQRIKKALDTCVGKIQRNQNADGSIQGAGWAGVLQSALANNALESAQTKGAVVDEKGLDKSRSYQKGNYDAKTGDVKTEMGAGVMLYSVTGSARASAKEARKVKEEMERAKKDGRIAQQAPASVETLQEIGFTRDDAMKYATAYDVYESAKVQAQREDVMDGFGSNGGEEFVSYLQTGESMIINKDTAWQNWFDSISGKLLSIQNDNGCWSGHHCITSPVFCTATCLLILSVNNDIDKLGAIGEK
jgi:hypothetical protein